MRCLLLFSFLLSITAASARNLKVCNTCPYKSIKAALAAAADRDTITIGPGTYREGNLEITKSVCFRGKGNPVIDGQKKFQAITVKAPNVTIEGVTITGSGQSSLDDLAAIKVLNVGKVLIQNNTLLDNFFGIYLSNSNDGIVRNNRLTGSNLQQQGSGNGIHLWKCKRALVENNHITGHRDGIYFEFVTESYAKRNVSEYNLRYGLHFMFSHDDTYEGNTFRNNGAGVAVMYTQNVIMTGNHFELNWGSGSYAILLKDIRDSEIKGNTFGENTTGIYAESASRILITENTFIKNGWALRLTASCDMVVITKNNFIGNTFDMATNTSSPMATNTYNQNYWDKYDGYDLDRNGEGDVPYYPVSLSTMLVEKIPASVFFLHSFVLGLIDKSEKLVPQLIPEGIRDNNPYMKRLVL